MAKTVYLERANIDLFCLCECTRSLVGSPSQLDCPWCGCGWLFTCIHCRKPFTFARAVEIDMSLEELCILDSKGRWGKDPSPDQVQEWVESMRVLLKDVEIDHTYVYLDGWYIDAQSDRVSIEGWHSWHDLPWVPQVKALADEGVLETVLSSRQYWENTAL